MSDSETAIVPSGDNEPAAPLCDACPTCGGKWRSMVLPYVIGMAVGTVNGFFIAVAVIR